MGKMLAHTPVAQVLSLRYQNPSQPLRFTTQILVATLSIWIGVQFYLWVRWAESGGVIGKENRERNPAETPPRQTCCTKLRYVCKCLINEILVEATGVELFWVLTPRNLLIPGTATTARRAPLPDPLYVYCTKILSV
jgi:hypothetical protein